MSTMEVKVIDATERLDAASVTEFKERTRDILSGQNTLMIIDFSETKFIDSAGLGALVSALKTASQAENIKIALITLSPQINRIFELTKLYRLFEIFDTQEEAEAALLD